MTTRWIYRDEIEEDAVIQFAQELNINTTIAKNPHPARHFYLRTGKKLLQAFLGSVA
jgi:hypothetical protein